MTRSRRARLPSTTIAHSTTAVAVAFSLLVGACAHAQTRTAADAREAPPPHLRGPADGGSVSGHAEHTDPIPDPAAGSEVSLGGILAFADQRSPVLTVARSTRSRAEAARVAAEQAEAERLEAERRAAELVAAAKAREQAALAALLASAASTLPTRTRNRSRARSASSVSSSAPSVHFLWLTTAEIFGME